MPDTKSVISLSMFDSVIRQGLEPAAQAALTQALAKLKLDLRELEVQVIEAPVCKHTITDDGLFTVACSECGIQVDASPDMTLVEGLIEEAKKNYANGEGELEMDEEALSDLLVRAATESVVNYVFADSDK